MSKTVLKKGIDVSYAQGTIDFTKLKGNVDFVIIRCGYGGDYSSQDDKQWLNNVKGCEDNGIPYGVYLYSYATTTAKAKSEAAHAIRLLKGHTPDYPVFLDLEESSISALGKSAILSIAKTFCTAIEDAGYTYGTYANKNWFTNYLTDSWYDTHTKWIAQYNSTVTYTGSYDLWQYSSTGKVSGISGNVDMNYCYTSFIKGDADGSGKVTASDARTILRVAAGLEDGTAAAEDNLDVNGDGKVTAADARAALRTAAGLSSD
ncbi:MAG: dockerin type I domain-containing protein [Clostridiales bacterium]|nr:dockerin type I domain-containing protein [Clostridiales bacterium]